jgi:hypothetical protein
MVAQITIHKILFFLSLSKSQLVRDFFEEWENTLMA